MKKILSSIALIIVAVSVNAQSSRAKSTSFSLGLEGAVPMGKFNDEGYNFGIGGSVQLEHKVAPDLGLALYAGYINHANTKTSFKYHFTAIPVMGGIKYWFSPKVYAQGLLGAAFNGQKPSNTTGQSYSSTGFAYSPALGFLLSKNIDFLVKYFGNNIKIGNTDYTRSSVGARLAYNF